MSSSDHAGAARKDAGLDAAKAAARKRAFAARREAYGQGLDARANAHLLAFLAPIRPRAVAGYMPIRTEISPLEAMDALHAGGVAVGVPVIEGAGRPLVFHLWSPEAEMVEGPFGARVPRQGEAMIPDVIIAPLVAFDARGFRLGYGGGFYDRTIAALREAGHDPLVVGFAYAAQELPEVPAGPTDMPLDAVVTERGVRRFG